MVTMPGCGSSFPDPCRCRVELLLVLLFVFELFAARYCCVGGEDFSFKLELLLGCPLYPSTLSPIFTTLFDNDFAAFNITPVYEAYCSEIFPLIPPDD